MLIPYGHYRALIGFQPDNTACEDPLTTKEALKILEHLYDLVLDIEQLRREQSSLNAEDPEAVEAWYVNSNPSSLNSNSLKGMHDTLNSFKNYGIISELWYLWRQGKPLLVVFLLF